MTQGYTQAYALDPATDSSAKRIEKEKMNGLFNLITNAIREIQVSGVAPFISASDNGGTAFVYGEGALVSLGGKVYMSLENENSDAPPLERWRALGDASFRDVGTNTNQIPDMGSFSRLMKSSGYQKLSGGASYSVG